MSNSQKLTKRFVESITAHKKDELLIWDSEIKGFGVRIFPTGRRTYFVQYRNQFGNTRRKKIGVHGNITADQAREEAKKLLGDVAKGKDPSKDQQNEKIKPTFNKLSEEYLKYSKAEKKPKSFKEDERMLQCILLKRLGYKKLEEITTYEIQQIHHELRDTLYAANRVRSLLNRMFNLAIQWQWTSTNPVIGVKKYKEHKRNRWLNDQEVQQLFTVLETYQDQGVANAVRLLLLTGSRKGEVLGATWDQFDLEKGVWTKPDHSTKQKKMEHVPLSPQVKGMLNEMRARSSSPYLFPGRVPGHPLKDIKKGWKTICGRAGVPEVRIHDLRHTYASHLVSSGLSLSIVGKLLGHTQAATTQRYAHLADSSLRQATEFFGNKVEKLTSKEM
jgi:integrase